MQVLSVNSIFSLGTKGSITFFHKEYINTYQGHQTNVSTSISNAVQGPTSSKSFKSKSMWKSKYSQP